MLKLGALIGLAATFAAGCGSSNHAADRLKATTCGTPYTFSFSSHSPVISGSCAGLLPRVPPAVMIHLGERFSVLITSNMDGTLAFPVPAPNASAIEIISRSGATVAYRGSSVGTASLVAHHTRFCEALDPRVGSCAVLKVRVEP